jgi:hypothetical protein
MEHAEPVGGVALTKITLEDEWVREGLGVKPKIPLTIKSSSCRHASLADMHLAGCLVPDEASGNA